MFPASSHVSFKSVHLTLGLVMSPRVHMAAPLYPPLFPDPQSLPWHANPLPIFQDLNDVFLNAVMDNCDEEEEEEEGQ